jgi:hypothetical protein
MYVCYIEDSSGFKTGPAKSHPNLAKRAFSKLEHASLAGAGFETGPESA